MRKGNRPRTDTEIIEQLEPRLPGDPGFPHDELAWFDSGFLRWIQDSRAGRTPHIDHIGVAYMYVGAGVKGASVGHEFHEGPHLMVVGPHQDEFQGSIATRRMGCPT